MKESLSDKKGGGAKTQTPTSQKGPANANFKQRGVTTIKNGQRSFHWEDVGKDSGKKDTTIQK